MPSYLFNTINLIHLIIEFIDKLFGIIPNNKPITSPILPPHIIHTTHVSPPKLPSQIIKNKEFYSPSKLPSQIIKNKEFYSLPKLPILPVITRTNINPKRTIFIEKNHKMELLNKHIIPKNNISTNSKLFQIINNKPYKSKSLKNLSQISINPNVSLSKKLTHNRFIIPSYFIIKLIPKRSFSQIIKNNSISKNITNNSILSKTMNLSQIPINLNVSLSQTLTQGRKIIASKPKNISSSTNNTSNNTTKNNHKSNFQFSKIKLLPNISLSNIIHNKKLSIR